MRLLGEKAILSRLQQSLAPLSECAQPQQQGSKVPGFASDANSGGSSNNVEQDVFIGAYTPVTKRLWAERLQWHTNLSESPAAADQSSGALEPKASETTSVVYPFTRDKGLVECEWRSVQLQCNCGWYAYCWHVQHTRAQKHRHPHTYARARAHTCTHVHTHIHVHVRTRTRTHTHTHVCRHAHTNTAECTSTSTCTHQHTDVRRPGMPAHQGHMSHRD